MRCKRCGQEMKVKSVEVGKDTQGNPIYNDYAFCYECKIKINLDKKKDKEGQFGEAGRNRFRQKNYMDEQVGKTATGTSGGFVVDKIFEAR